MFQSKTTLLFWSSLVLLSEDCLGFLETRQRATAGGKLVGRNHDNEVEMRSPMWTSTRRTTTPCHDSSRMILASGSASSSSSSESPASIDATNNNDLPLQPFLPALNPNFRNVGTVGQESFVVSRQGGPTDEELTNENMLKIVLLECNDLEVNTLVWKCLGYRFDDETKQWVNDDAFPNFRDRFPTPPDFIGMQRIYSKAVDEQSLRANQSLVRSIPLEFKQCLKPALKPLGWTGYKMDGLTPNKTRRAQCANWLIYYRDHLYGYTVEELREQRRVRKLKQEEEEQERLAQLKEQGLEDTTAEEEFRPPVNEVF